MSAKLLKLINDERTLISVLKAKMCVNAAPVVDYYCGANDIYQCSPSAALDEGCDVKDLASCSADAYDYWCHEDMAACSAPGTHDLSCWTGDYSICNHPNEID